jgi:aspartyl-tRNA(Asn)/glutamyl-tRNA(Gln) amidotransferase subunit A
MKAEEILQLGLADVARQIRHGALTSRAVTEAALDGLERRGPELNALARLHREEALAEAEACDRERARGSLRGPLHGVPLAHKDMYHRAGRLSEMGTRIYRGNIAQVTSTAVSKLDAAGAIDVGRLNMVEFALGVTGHNAHTGHPRNAWDPARVTGGSTSGGATAVAARLAFATLGSDTGGSIRVPASLCGIVGIKPTYGRVSRWGAMPLSFSLDHVGPLCRSSEDAALMLEAIAGHDPRDRSTSPRPVPRYRDALGPGLEQLRVGVVPPERYEFPLAPAVEKAFKDALDGLKALGARVEICEVPEFTPFNGLRRAILVAEIAALHRELVRTRRADYNQTTLSRMLPGFALDSADYLRALSARGPLTRSFCREVFSRCDVLALPTTPVPTPRIDETDTQGDSRYVEASNQLGSLIGPFNYTGLPAISTPMGFDDSGMPLGLQLVARPFAEALLLRTSHQFERATGWLERRPPGF